MPQRMRHRRDRRMHAANVDRSSAGHRLSRVGKAQLRQYERGGGVQSGDAGEAGGGTHRRFAAWLGVSLAALVLASVAQASEGLDLPSTGPQLLALLKVSALLALLFAAFAFLVNRILLGPLARILSEREQRTTGDQQRASELRGEAAQAADRLGAKLREARIEAQRTRAALLAEGEAAERKVLDLARSEAARASAEVRSSVASELEGARATLRGQASGLAREAAAQILGRAL
jgi:F0F1-type ATP synthase membrane subunit b/b'